MSMAVPMLEAVTVEPPTDELKATYDAKATSLRRACTALLFFSVVCSRPWPSAGWLGVAAAVSVLCSTSTNLLCRTRITRFLSGLVAICALVTLAISIRADLPQRAASEVRKLCVDMPADTFEWGQRMLNEHECARKGVAFLSRHASDEAAAPLMASDSLIASDSLANPMANATELAVVMSQEEKCGAVARFVQCVAKMMVVGSAIAHFLLFVSAVAVVKRACRLRCAAYRCGLLEWKRCGGCKFQRATNNTPVAVTAPTKELA